MFPKPDKDTVGSINITRICDKYVLGKNNKSLSTLKRPEKYRKPSQLISRCITVLETQMCRINFSRCISLYASVVEFFQLRFKYIDFILNIYHYIIFETYKVSESAFNCKSIQNNRNSIQIN